MCLCAYVTPSIHTPTHAKLSTLTFIQILSFSHTLSHSLSTAGQSSWRATPGWFWSGVFLACERGGCFLRMRNAKNTPGWFSHRSHPGAVAKMKRMRLTSQWPLSVFRDGRGSVHLHCLFIDRPHFTVFTRVVPLFSIVKRGEFIRRSVKKTWGLRSSRMLSDTLCVVTNVSQHGVSVKRST